MVTTQKTIAPTLIEEGVFNRIKKDRSFAVACVFAVFAIVLGFAAAMVVAGTGHSTDAACAMFYIGLVLTIFVFASWHLFFNRRGETPFGWADGRLLMRLVLYSLLLGLVLDVLTYLSYTSGEFNFLTLSNSVKFAICVFLSYMLFLVIAYQNPDVGDRIKTWLLRVFARRNVIRGAIVVVGALVLGCIAGKVSEIVANVSCYTASIFWIAVCFVLLSFVVLRHSAGEHPERCFLVVALAFGCVMCFCTPQATLLSWDDDTHFGYASGLSYLNNPETLTVGINVESPYRSNSPYNDGTEFTQDDFDNFHETINTKIYHAKKHVVSGFVTEDDFTTLRINTACYAPAAVGLWLGRLLHVSFSTMYLMGRLFELLFYCLMCYFAIKIAPARKIVLSVVALLPTALFLASVYSYDYWLNCFAILGVALVIREVCTPEKKLTARAWLGMCACFFLAILPKLIYFPLFGLMFLLPRSKFSSAKQRKYYYATIVLCILFAVASFVAPMLFHTTSGDVVGDERGGSNISAAGQISFILSEPLHYAAILGNFLSDYLSVSGVDDWSLFIGWLGHLAVLFPAVRGVTALLLVSAALTNCDEKSACLSKKGTVIWTGIIAVGTVVLVATALYAMFTSVGSETIGGCQPRYLIPVAVVFFVFTLNPRVKMRADSASYVLTYMSLAALMNAACAWFLIVSAVAA